MDALLRLIRFAAWSLAFLLALYAGTCWFIVNQTITPRRMIVSFAPSQLGYPEAKYIDLKSTTDGLTLRSWLIPATGESAIILVHGIHSQSWDGHQYDLANAYNRAGFHVLLIDLRGHGKSAGDSVGLGLLERGDIDAAVNELRNRGFASGKIGIHGTSYGAAVSLLAAAEIPEIGGVVADSSFADVQDVISGEVHRETGLPLSLAKYFLPGVSFLSMYFHAIDLRKSGPEMAIRRVSPRPVLLIHGTEDSVIPFSQALRLKAAGGSTTQLWPLEGRDHTEGLLLFPDTGIVSPLRSQYLRKTTEFFRAVL